MKIGLVLGSGGLRGLAHVGVLKVLLSHGAWPDVVIPQDMYSIGWDSFWKPAQVFEGGEQATLAIFPRILEKLGR